jgi:hypothetical protein
MIGGESVEAVYLPGEVHELYRFFSAQPRRMGVTLEAVDGEGNLNLQVLIYDSQQQNLSRVAVPEGDPLLRGGWDLPAAGWYIVQVYGPETQPRAFRLGLIILPTPQDSGGMISYGESRSGEIAIQGQRDRWAFEGVAGDSVMISMIAPGADGYLVLLAPDGQVIAQNDDGPSGSSDPVLILVLPATGNYVILARLYGDDQTGAYRIILERAEP